jgi:TRIAP1/MDM35 family protein
MNSCWYRNILANVLAPNRRYDSCFLKWYSESKFLSPSLFSLFTLFLSSPILSSSFASCYFTLSGFRDVEGLSITSRKNQKKKSILTIISTEYLRGTATSDECEPLFAKYKQCLSVSFLPFPTPFPFLLGNITDANTNSQRALKDRGIDKMLDEARADNRENDLENMKPGSG